MENPLNNPDSDFNSSLFYMDVLMTVFFSLECILKICAFGFYWSGRESYLKSMYN
jgi:hypothetical protein